jgi:hypothetical protein
MNISMIHTITQDNTSFFGSTPETLDKALIIMNIINQVWGDRFSSEFVSDTKNVYTFNDTTLMKLTNSLTNTKMCLAQWKNIVELTILK